MKAAAARKLAAAAAEQAVTTYGLPRDVDPHAALIEELHRTAGHVAYLSLTVAALKHDHLVHGITKTIQLPDGSRRVEAEAAISVWVQLYQAERKHFTDVAKTCIVAGIEERRVKIAEEQGELLATAIRGILTDLGVADDPKVPGVVRRHLTLVAG